MIQRFVVVPAIPTEAGPVRNGTRFHSTTVPAGFDTYDNQARGVAFDEQHQDDRDSASAAAQPIKASATCEGRMAVDWASTTRCGLRCSRTGRQAIALPS